MIIVKDNRFLSGFSFMTVKNIDFPFIKEFFILFFISIKLSTIGSPQEA
jgi:hypothetical protein